MKMFSKLGKLFINFADRGSSEEEVLGITIINLNTIIILFEIFDF